MFSAIWQVLDLTLEPLCCLVVCRELLHVGQLHSHEDLQAS